MIKEPPRLNNIFDYHTFTVEVIDIKGKDIKMSIVAGKNDPLPASNVTSALNLFPITLNKTWLPRFGFKPDPLPSTVNATGSLNKGDYWISADDSFIVRIVNKKIYYIDHQCTTVHELQNLYEDATGKKLLLLQ